MSSSRSLLRMGGALRSNYKVFEMENRSFLRPTPPMGIYGTLYNFWDTYGQYMG